MFVDFFIRRPIFAFVASFLLLLAGAIAIPTLPVAQYPNVTPPQVTVSAVYTGASAEVVETAVTTVLEQEINGVPGLRYISSTSGSDGTSSINITFDLDRDLDTAAVEVQNRVATAEARLPAEVRALGVTVRKQSNSIVMAIGLRAKDNRYDSLFLSNYADLYLRNALKRIEGVGDVRIFGERTYAMRLWLDPGKLARRGLTPADVVDALREQNVQVAAGQIGQPPTAGEQLFQLNVRARGRLIEASEFANIVVASAPNGALVRLGDVGRAELGAENYNSVLRFNGQEAVGLGIFQLPNANALDVARSVRAELARLAERFPPGLEYTVALDTTLAVDKSIEEVLWTLGIAIVLVVLVIYVFLQNWKSTLIPAITIPFSLVGTFVFLRLFGFSINTLTLFGITLATGLVVDDAIIVIENVARLVQEKRLSPREATSEAMAEVTGAVIATSLVLAAVFVPVAFFPGTTGQLYQQFAITISVSVAISTFNALTLAPALAARLVGSEGERERRLFAPFNRFLDWLRRGYDRSLGRLVTLKSLVVVFFLAGLGGAFWLWFSVPTGFLPDEDQGYFIVTVQGPDGASLAYTTQAMEAAERVLLQVPEVRGAFAVAGFSQTGSSPSNGTMFVNLAPWDERERTLEDILAAVRPRLAAISQARVIPFSPPAIRGLGTFGGFQYQLQDPLGGEVDTLARATSALIGRANADPRLEGVFSGFRANAPQLFVEVDRNRAKALGVALTDIFNTLQVLLGSQYVNDFTLGTRVYRVYVQADAPFRNNPDDIRSFYVKGRNGLVPLANLMSVREITAPQTISHFNLFRAAEINGSPAPGVSSGQALTAMEELSERVLPRNLTYAWSGISLEQIEAGSQAVLLFALGLVFVFLVLAAQYESFIDPLVIMLAVPLAILGALAAQALRGLPNDVFAQIGLVMLIGLASKNSILIVEFANQLRSQGRSLTEAAIEASQTRLRPILMTALSFILGLLPLVFATGAGAGARNSLGTAVLGGMVVSTFLSLFVVPILYILFGMLEESVRKRFGWQSREGAPEQAQVERR